MVTMLKNKCSVWKRIKFPTFWYNCYYYTWSDTYFIQLETLLINHPSQQQRRRQKNRIRKMPHEGGHWRSRRQLIYSNTIEPLSFIFIDCHSKCGFDRKSSSAQFEGHGKFWRTYLNPGDNDSCSRAHNFCHRSSSTDIPKLCSAEHQVLREASPSAPQRDWKEK